MSIRSCQDNVARALKELADLEKKSAEETKREVSKSKEIDRIQRSITSSASSSTIHSKNQQILRMADDIAKIKAKRADFAGKIADKTVQLNRYREALSKEEEKERKKVAEAERRRERERLEYQRSVTRELTQQKNIRMNFESGNVQSEEYDAFISHASEDKDEFVRPLADKLNNSGYKIWYDEFELKVGDSLRRSIDRGLSKSRYGIVILSSSFFSKNWPQYELDGLVAKEMEGRKVVLPIWHKVSKDEVKSYSPSLADKVAINSSISGLDEIVEQLGEVLGKRET
jgi:hypothetical protein